MLLTLFVAITGAYVVTRLVANSLEERLSNQLLESGELTQADMPPAKTKTAPEITATKAATVTIKQFETVLEAFRLRVGNIEYGAGRDDIDLVLDNTSMAIAAIVSNLQRVIDDEAQRAADERAEAQTVSPIKSNGK